MESREPSVDVRPPLHGKVHAIEVIVNEDEDLSEAVRQAGEEDGPEMNSQYRRVSDGSFDYPPHEGAMPKNIPVYLFQFQQREFKSPEYSWEERPGRHFKQALFKWAAKRNLAPASVRTLLAIPQTYPKLVESLSTDDFLCISTLDAFKAASSNFTWVQGSWDVHPSVIWESGSTKSSTHYSPQRYNTFPSWLAFVPKEHEVPRAEQSLDGFKRFYRDEHKWAFLKGAEKRKVVEKEIAQLPKIQRKFIERLVSRLQEGLLCYAHGIREDGSSYSMASLDIMLKKFSDAVDFTIDPYAKDSQKREKDFQTLIAGITLLLEHKNVFDRDTIAEHARKVAQTKEFLQFIGHKLTEYKE